MNQQEEKYKTIFELSPEAIGILDNKGKILDINGRVYEWLGYRPKEVIGKNILEVPYLTKESKAKVREKFSQRMSGRKIPPYELDFVTKQGKKVVGRVLATPILDKNRKIIGDIVMISDITEQKKAEEELRESEDRFRQFFEHEPICCYMISPKGTIINVNNAVLKKLGYKKEELVGKPLKTIYASESLPRVKQLFNKWKRTGELKEEEMVILTKSGERRTILLSASVVRDKNGKILHSISLQQDITKRKQMEKRLSESEERFKNIISSSPDAITVTDLNGNIIDCNKATLNMHDFSVKKELIGRKAFDLIAPKDHQRAAENMKKTLKQGLVKNIEYTFLTRGGCEFPAELSASIIRDASGKPTSFIAITKDISERKKVDQMKTEFVSLASHQLRTPLSIINWYTEMLLADSMGKLNQDQKQYLNEVYYANQRMVSLINTLLNVSRIELGTFTIKPKPTNLAKVVDSLLSEFSSKIKNKKLRVVKKYDKRLPSINVDPELIRVVFQNLISNAVQYTPPRGRVGINIKKRKADILITIADTGYGIPKHQQHDVFTKMFRADNIIKKEPDGTGLGLYMAKYMVEQSGGKIWFKSEENKGTTFYVTIPLKSIKKEKGRKN